MIRSIVAVVAGYLVMVVGARIYVAATGSHDTTETAYTVSLLIAGLIIAGAGGFVAAIIAIRRESWHGIALGVALGVALAVYGPHSMLGYPEDVSAQLTLGIALVCVIGPVIGAYLRTRTLPRAEV
jgi:peptidoglycan/LPS O-acetylase OafA/YrhL